MRYFEAETPDYETTGWSQFSLDPPEYGVDWCLVGAQNKREAKIKAHRYFMSSAYRNQSEYRIYHTYYDNCCKGYHPPYKCIKLNEITNDPQWYTNIDELRELSYYVE